MVVTFRLMPDSMRRKRVSQKNAPRTITKWDLHDEFGESPYRVTEVVADKLWSTVQYSKVQYSTVQCSIVTLTTNFRYRKLGDLNLEPATLCACAGGEQQTIIKIVIHFL